MSNPANSPAIIDGQQDENHPASKVSDPKQGPSSTAKLIIAHHSTRAFLPTPVPQPLLEEILQLAQRAPSNSNIQPWRMHILTGAALQRLSAKLTAVAKSGAPPTAQSIPDAFRHYRSELGHRLYGPEGYNISRSDTEALLAARLRNYSFFEAPVGAIVSMDGRLAQPDALSVGLYLQTLCLLLAESGVATCIVVSVTEYPEVVREALGLGADMVLLTGLAAGYEDEAKMVNHFRTERDAWRECVTFLEE